MCTIKNKTEINTNNQLAPKYYTESVLGKYSN